MYILILLFITGTIYPLQHGKYETFNDCKKAGDEIRRNLKNVTALCVEVEK